MGREFRVLNKGFVRLVDYLGGDARIVQAARVSYQEGTKTVREDSALIDYLVRHKHTSPLEQVVLTFHLKLPIFVARQWLRHRTARLNEISGRYSVMRDEFYLPDEAQVRQQSAANKQGRSDEEVPAELRAKTLELLQTGQQGAYTAYQELLDEDVARELARVNLPLSLYTEMYWQIDLHNLFHFLRLRLDAHAQYEIRVYGEAVAEIARALRHSRTERLKSTAYTPRRFHVLRWNCYSRQWTRRCWGRALATSDLRKTRQRELLDKLSVTAKTPLYEPPLPKEETPA